MKPKLIACLLVGAPGCGKTTSGKSLCEKNPSFVRICPDEFRAKFGTGEGDQTVSGKAFQASRDAMDEALKNNKNVVIDATNMYRKTRKDFLDIAKKYNAKTVALVFEVEKSVLLNRNINRGNAGGRNVPEDVIQKMLDRYERPTTLEFNEVQFISKL